MSLEVNYDELNNLFIGRAGIYEYFALIFKEPLKAEFLGLTERYIDIFKGIFSDSENEKLCKAIDMLEECVNQEKDEHILSELNRTYTSLFYLGFASVPTTASGAISPGGTMKQEPWERVMAIYKKWGYKPDTCFREPEDHLYVQLKFLERLSSFMKKSFEEKDYEAFNNGALDTKQILSELLLWIDVFTGLVEKRYAISNYNCKLYLAVSIIIREFIFYDKDTLLPILIDIAEKSMEK